MENIDIVSMENIDIDWESLLNAYTKSSKQRNQNKKQWLKAKNLRPNQRICPYCGKKIDGGEANA